MEFHNLLLHLGFAGETNLTEWLFWRALLAYVTEMELDIEIIFELLALLNRVRVDTLFVESVEVVFFNEAGVYRKPADQFF